MPVVERARAVVAGLRASATFETSSLHAADDVPDRVAAERVAAQEHDVDRQDDRAEADAELLRRRRRIGNHSASHTS